MKNLCNEMLILAIYESIQYCHAKYCNIMLHQVFLRPCLTLGHSYAEKHDRVHDGPQLIEASAFHDPCDVIRREVLWSDLQEQTTVYEAAFEKA